MNAIIESLFSTDGAFIVKDFSMLAYFALAIFLFWIATAVQNLLAKHHLQEELTKKDNKAIAVSFSAYLLSVALIQLTIMGSESEVQDSSNYKEFLVQDLLSTFVWTLIGIVMLQIARIINEKYMLFAFCTDKELIEDRNVGTGLVQAGSFIGSALIIRASLSGDTSFTFTESLFLVLLYFFITQLILVFFGRIYQKICGYDLHKEIEKDNLAAGLSFGGAIIGISISISGYIMNYNSIFGLFVWFIISSIILFIGRFLIDRLILPSAKIKDEIVIDQNWGVSAIEAIGFIGLALVMNALL